MNRIATNHEVLTLAEAARFLRIKKPLLQRLAEARSVPARLVGDEWRFLRSALEEWLRGQPDSQMSLLQQAGLFQNDPDLPRILADIYKARGRPEHEGD